MFKKLLALAAALYAAASFAAVDVNTATAADLDSVKGIGPAVSSRIVEERKKGNFKDWNDLVVRVKGVGNKNAARFSDGGLTVNGATYTGAPAAATAPATRSRRAASAAAMPAAGNTPAPNTTAGATMPAPIRVQPATPGAQTPSTMPAAGNKPVAPSGVARQ